MKTPTQVHPKAIMAVEGTGQQGLANNWGDGVCACARVHVCVCARARAPRPHGCMCAQSPSPEHHPPQKNPNAHTGFWTDYARTQAAGVSNPTPFFEALMGACACVRVREYVCAPFCRALPSACVPRVCARRAESRNPDDRQANANACMR